jgi:molecular chaperone GrpE
MTEAKPEEASVGAGGDGPVIRDRRRIDPKTGRVRDPDAGKPVVVEPVVVDSVVEAGPVAGAEVAEGAVADAEVVEGEAVEPVVEPDPAAVAAERLADLQRLQAEYVNYRKRVERDRDVARDQAVTSVLESLLPVMDDVHLARQHGDLEGGPFAAIADKLDAVLARFGLQRFGEPGEAFDPAVHEALMRTEAELAEGTEVTTVVQVLQPGYQVGERVLRAARVSVADPP